MNVILIAIGDEVLLGDTVDTNSAWLGRHLSEINYEVIQQWTIGDDEDQIIQAMSTALVKADLVIVTGGLGPTNDDKTKDALCRLFQTQLTINEELKNKVTRYYVDRGRSADEVTSKMIELPASATMVPNHYGVAPALWFYESGKQLIALTGVPFEMKGIMTDAILPKLARQTNQGHLVYRYFLTSGKGETVLAQRLHSVESDLPSGFTLSYLPSFSSVKIRLTGKGENLELLNQQADHLRELILPHLQDVLFSEHRDGSLVRSVAALANQKQLTIGAAESCTGGNIAHQLTLEPGSSSYFLGGIVAYSNQVKQHILGVQESTLRSFGAVSNQTVEEMVKGTLRQLSCDVAVAVSGIAGPSGGSPEKPVGTVCIAVGDQSQVISKRYTFVKNREKNIDLATMMSLNQLFRFLNKTNQE